MRSACSFLFLLTFLASVPISAQTDDIGTLGISFAQLFDDDTPDHRGPLVVLRLQDGSPGVNAGLHPGDFVIAVDGRPTPGREFRDILFKELRGPIGATVHLTVVKPDGSQSDAALVRAAYPPHLSHQNDPFTYQVPGSWAADQRYPFPLPWWPAIPYKGFEDIYFSPNFFLPESPEYHSFLFFLWVDGDKMLDATQLQSDVLSYFLGISEERGKNYHFTPDLSKVAAKYTEDAPSTFAGSPARAFSGAVTIWDTHGKVITLNSEVRIARCGEHTAFFFAQSLEPRDGAMWKRLDAVRDTFQCRR